MEFALAGPVFVISWIIVTCIAYIINQIFFFKSNFFLHNILVSWFYAITITLSPTYSPILCPPRWSLPLLGCVMWGLMSSVIDLSVSQSARWLQLLSLTVCVTSDWVTPACWSCRLQAVDKRVELLTGRFRRDRQQDGAELSWLTGLHWTGSFLSAVRRLRNTGRPESLQGTEEAELISPVPSVIVKWERGERRVSICYNELQYVPCLSHPDETDVRIKWEQSGDSSGDWETGDDRRVGGSEVVTQLRSSSRGKQRVTIHFNTTDDCLIFVTRDDRPSPPLI